MAPWSRAAPITAGSSVGRAETLSTRPSALRCPARWAAQSASSSVTTSTASSPAMSADTRVACSAAAAPPNRTSRPPASPRHQASRASASIGVRVSATAARPSASGSSVVAVTVAVPAGNGCSRTATLAMRPSVPREPVKSLPRSYPATFLMTRPPDDATLPSESTTVAPMMRSRGPPYRCRAGPESAVANSPPTVPPGSAGSTASH